MTTGAGLRPIAKAVEWPPDPTDGAPALDPTVAGKRVEPMNGMWKRSTERLLRHRQTKGCDGERVEPRKQIGCS